VATSAKITSPDGGHFENGRWVTTLTPLLEYLEGKMDIDTPSFEITVKEEVPIFAMGRCVGYYTKERSLGLFSQRQVMEMLPKSANDISTFPKGGDLKVVVP